MQASLAMSAPCSVADTISEFCDSRGAWVDQLRDNDEVLYCLPTAEIDVALKLFRLTREAEEAERELCMLCDEHEAIGISDCRFVRYRYLRPIIPLPTDGLAEYLELGWTQDNIEFVQTNDTPTAGLNARLKSSIGRLISMPNFNRAVALLHQDWCTLEPAIRPPLPIHCTFVFPARLEKHQLQLAPRSLKEFMTKFDEFCHIWQLQGMATWQLPLPQGPILTPGVTTEGAVAHGNLSIRVPWHFPLEAGDGVGTMVLEEHRRRALEKGVDDQQSWRTYASFTDLQYWDHVFRNRYRREQRIKAFVTAMVAVHGDTVNLDTERVQKMRKTLKSLQDGKLKSLKGRR